MSEKAENYEELVNENHTLRSQLDSKCRALAILSQELSALKSERANLIKYIDQQRHSHHLHTNNEDFVRQLTFEVETLKHKLRDALGDVQALRSKNQQCHDSAKLLFVEPKAPPDKEILVENLEAARRREEQLVVELQTTIDAKEELLSERDAYKAKLHRLNYECNMLYNSGGKAVIDFDALIMENRLLQERLESAKEECQMSKNIVERYKSLISSLNGRKLSQPNNQAEASEKLGGVFLSQKEVRKLLESSDPNSKELNLKDLKSLALALLDSLSDKSLALAHQKRANRILAERVSELEIRIEKALGKQVPVSPSSALLEGYRDDLQIGEISEDLAKKLGNFDDSS